jgi:hypothetical protein
MIKIIKEIMIRNIIRMIELARVFMIKDLLKSPIKVIAKIYKNKKIYKKIEFIHSMIKVIKIMRNTIKIITIKAINITMINMITIRIIISR